MFTCYDAKVKYGNGMVPLEPSFIERWEHPK
jgi:hypothetical protein